MPGMKPGMTWREWFNVTQLRSYQSNPHEYELGSSSMKTTTRFVLSKEGQEILLGADYFPADPNVPPGPMLAPVVPKLAGVPENFVGPDKLMKYTDSSEEIFRQLFR